MFEVGFTEIVLIVGLALLVLGPEKLPGLVNKIGRWTGRARSMARQLRTQLEHEVTLEEMARSRPMQPGPAPGASNPEPYEPPLYDSDSGFIPDAPPPAPAASEPSRVDLTKPPQ